MHYKLPTPPPPCPRRNQVRKLVLLCYMSIPELVLSGGKKKASFSWGFFGSFLTLLQDRVYTCIV